MPSRTGGLLLHHGRGDGQRSTEAQAACVRAAPPGIALHGGRLYSERDVNDVLASVHEDVAFWRRELGDYGYLTRERGIHRLAEMALKRPSWMAQEIPAWESLWLPRYLRGEITE